MGGRGAVAAAIVAWVGLLLGARCGIPAILGGLAIVAPLAWISWRAPPRVGAMLVLIALAAAAVARGGAHRLVLERARVAAGPEERLFRLSGRVAEPPQSAGGEPRAMIVVDQAEPPMIRGTRVRLRLPAGVQGEWGDRVFAWARLEPPLPRRNPGGYDARAASAAQDLAWTGRVFTARVQPGRGGAGWARATVGRWRAAVDRRLAGLDEQTRELVVPLLVGDRSALSTDLESRFKASGLIHLLALSGLHVAWLASVARAVAASLGVGITGRAVAGAWCALVYVGLAGPIPSLVRAAITEIVAAIARRRALDPLQGLGLAALIPLIVAPGWAEDLGFQLSCAATLGLVAIGGADDSEGGGLRWVRRSLASTIGAQTAAMPILLARFCALSWTAPFANLVAVPVSGLLLSATWIAVVVDLALPGAGRLWFESAETLASVLRWITERAGDLPRSLLPSGDHALPVWLAAVAAVTLCAATPPRTLAARSRPRSPARVALLSVGLGSLGLAWVALLAAPELRPPPGRFWWIALDVGQGDAQAIGFADGWWLVDSGPRSPGHDAGESVLLPFLRWAGVRRIETLVLTHDDGDHTGGAEAVRRAMPVARWCLPPAFEGLPGPSRRFRGVAAARGDRLREAPDVRVTWPPRRMPRELLTGDNAASVVLEIGEGAARLLLLADVDSTIERRLAATGPIGVLKVAHHGAATSTANQLLERARPRWAVVSCGRRNPFGHPAPGVIARLERSGARVRRTDREGAVWFEFEGAEIRPVDWRRRRPPSRHESPPGPLGPGSAGASRDP